MFLIDGRPYWWFECIACAKFQAVSSSAVGIVEPYPDTYQCMNCQAENYYHQFISATPEQIRAVRVQIEVAHSSGC